MTCRVGGIPEIRQYWDINYPDKVAVFLPLIPLSLFLWKMLTESG